MRSSAWFLAFLVLTARSVLAEVVRIEISSREDVLQGRPFGLAGPYETLAGKVHFAVDPENPVNQVVTDIDRAPRNAAGRVEFAADFYLLKPQVRERANGALLLDVPNRGRKMALRFLDFAEPGLDPATESHVGDGFLLRQGFTLLWVGWQWDTPQEEGRLRLYAPIATEEGRPLRGLVRSDFVPMRPESDHSLAADGHLAYPAADPDAPENVLTVRDAVEGPRKVIPRRRWHFGRLENGAFVEDSTRVYLEGGFEPHRIYEVVYVAKDPPLVGLGPAVIRDMVSHLKFEGSEELSLPRGAIDRALAFGFSQSGRFLRAFLFHGYNEDEAHRKVLDGLLAQGAGVGRGSFNHRFAQAARDGHPYSSFFYPTDIFPFTGREQIDFRTGTNAGLLLYQKREYLPKIFYVNSSYEYWGRAASLIHTSLDGREDIAPMDNVRIYHVAGTQHMPAPFPPNRTTGRQANNPLDYRWSLRALLLALDRWVRDDVSPPASRYPQISEGTLVAPDVLAFPPIPFVETPSRPHRAYRVDYGPRFLSEGIVSRQPPEVGSPYAVLVPAVDEDGNELGGIELPEHAVPLATYTGWNLFNEASGPTRELATSLGSYIPFPRTPSERRAADDSRRAIEERYSGRQEYLGRLAAVALSLVEDGYLLPEDVPSLLRSAERRWSYLMEPGSPR